MTHTLFRIKAIKRTNPVNRKKFITQEGVKRIMIHAVAFILFLTIMVFLFIYIFLLALREYATRFFPDVTFFF